MWELENQTPFAAEYSWTRDRNGSEVWLVAVKGTYLVHPDGSTSVAREQIPVCEVAEYRGEPDKSSLRYESDLLPSKPTTDILLTGHAYSPNGEPAREVDVTLKVAQVTKTLRVFGPRHWEKGVLGLGLTRPEPFEKLPITYERAFGGTDPKTPMAGWDLRNPVGTGFALSADALESQAAPNVEDPRDLLRSWKQRPRPAGFGPVAAHWSPRKEWGGTYDSKWEQERFPLVPSDFDDRFYLCAPEDQQPAKHLRGGEPVELHNLTPDGRLHFDLPRVRLGFTTRFLTGEIQHHRAALYTVILEPDLPRVLLVWLTQLPCHPTGLKLDRTIIIEKTGPHSGSGPDAMSAEENC